LVEVCLLVVIWCYVFLLQFGWPTLFDCYVMYWFDDDGLMVSIWVCNVGISCCFYGIGVYFYFMVGILFVDVVRLTLFVVRCFDIDDVGIFMGSRLVDGLLDDLCLVMLIGDWVFDIVYVDLVRDGDGCWCARLEGLDGGVVLWVDDVYGFVQVFIGDILFVDVCWCGVVIESMICLSDVFNVFDCAVVGVVVFELGDEYEVMWFCF